MTQNIWYIIHHVSSLIWTSYPVSTNLVIFRKKTEALCARMQRRVGGVVDIRALRALACPFFVKFLVLRLIVFIEVTSISMLINRITCGTCRETGLFITLQTEYQVIRFCLFFMGMFHTPEYVCCLHTFPPHAAAAAAVHVLWRKTDFPTLVRR